MLIYERVRTKRYLRFFNRYRHKLVFMGNLNVLGILVMGLAGYWYIAGTKYGPHVQEALFGLMSTAKLDHGMYRVVDWFQKKGRLIVYVTQEIRKGHHPY